MTPLPAWRTLVLLATRRHLPHAKTSLEPNRGWRRLGGMGVNAALLVVMGALVLAINVPFYIAHRMNQTIATTPWDSLEAWQVLGGASRQTMESLSHARLRDELLLPFRQDYEKSHAEGAGWLTGVAVAVEGPAAMVAPARAALARAGATVAACAPSCALLRWRERGGWALTPPGRAAPAPSDVRLGMMITVVLESAAPTVPPPPRLSVAPRQLSASVRQTLSESLSMFLHTLLWWAFCAFALSSGLIGVSWDRDRAQGKLEPWATAHHPPWVLYGSQLLRATVAATVGYGLVLLLTRLWGLPADWGFLLGLWVCLPPAVAVVGLWGMLATVLFHHENGRMFARLVLSPLTLGLAWILRLGLAWAVMKAVHPLQARTLLHQVLASGPWLGLGALALTALAAVLAWAVNARIGRRREGLRRTA